MEWERRRSREAQDDSRRMLELCRGTLQRCLAARVELQDRLRKADAEIDRLRRMLALERRVRDPDGRDPGV
jgi:hypothetical protein